MGGDKPTTFPRFRGYFTSKSWEIQRARGCGFWQRLSWHRVIKMEKCELGMIISQPQPGSSQGPEPGPESPFRFRNAGKYKDAFLP